MLLFAPAAAWRLIKPSQTYRPALFPCTAMPWRGSIHFLHSIIPCRSAAHTHKLESPGYSCKRIMALDCCSPHANMDTALYLAPAPIRLRRSRPLPQTRHGALPPIWGDSVHCAWQLVQCALKTASGQVNSAPTQASCQQMTAPRQHADTSSPHALARPACIPLPPPASRLHAVLRRLQMQAAACRIAPTAHSSRGAHACTLRCYAHPHALSTPSCRPTLHQPGGCVLAWVLPSRLEHAQLAAHLHKGGDGGVQV